MMVLVFEVNTGSLLMGVIGTELLVVVMEI